MKRLIMDMHASEFVDGLDEGLQTLVSVVIPCFNGAAYLKETLESVLAQTYQNFEIVLIDDGSTDNSLEIASGYTQIRTFSQKNLGVAMARNRGFAESKGRY